MLHAFYCFMWKHWKLYLDGGIIIKTARLVAIVSLKERALRTYLLTRIFPFVRLSATAPNKKAGSGLGA